MLLLLVRRGFTIASLAWAAALPLAALVSRPDNVRQSVIEWMFSAAVYAIGAAVCHQLPDRSFHIGTAQLAVCARCAGIYCGAALAATACTVARVPLASIDESTAGRARTTLALAALPTIATLAFEWSTGVTPGNAIRFLAGLPIGAAVAWMVVGPVRNVKVN